ncbi:HET-domain-containing protein [Setomelanomma holmii]|uniref:HET-domain-containing protein n=1 Tax=Setomelanomma holmii TaxID=210430 RepID=A0A9P4HF66_9PLEO|nr:HET-domain-containing protein [Setomelanomma holmii]
MAAAPTTPDLPEEIPRQIRSALLEYDDSKNEGTEAYGYSDLPKDKKRIRLLRLYPGVLRSPQVLCEMLEAEFVEGEPLPRIVGTNDTLTRPIKYEALSWRWGDEDNSEYTIMIRNDGEMYRKRVSQTLGLALKYLRRGQDRILWIDAICINQKNKEERSYQVSMMSLVYTRASQVCVWLGEDDDNSQKAFRFIRDDISHLKNFDQLCTEDVHAPKWRAFVALMQRDWFSRRWVVQEIALAPVASVYCGPDELEWRELAIAVELFVEVETATHRLSELLRKDAKSRLVPNWFEHISELGASLLVNATARIFREYQRGDEIVKGPKRRSLLSLEFLVTSLSIFDCGRPHDSVYALIAIARDASPNPPTSTKQKRHQALIAQVFGDQLEQKPYLLDYNSPYPDRDTTLGHQEPAAMNGKKTPLGDVSAEDKVVGRTISKQGSAASFPGKANTWSDEWERYVAQRRPLDESPRSLNTVTVRPKTHKDTRTMEQYREQHGCETQRTVTPFIKLAFPEHRRGAQPPASDNSSLQRIRRQDDVDKDIWKEHKEVIGNLAQDPQLEDILKVKAKLAGLDERMANQAKARSTALVGSRSPKPSRKDGKPKHASLQELGLPSWVARIDGAPFDIFPHPGMDMMKMGRKNADPLVGTPQDGHRNYSAGQTKVVDFKTLQFKRRAHLGHHSLYLKGFCFDRVEKVAQVSQAGAIPASWLDLAGWGEARRPPGMNGDLDDPPTAFWRTLVADRGRNDRNPPYYYARACKETILKGGIRSNAVDTTALIYNERNSIIAEFCRRVQAVIWNRALIKTNKGALGLVSEEVREGDLICIVYGCTVPVILRRETAVFKTKNGYDNEKLEDGIEIMKRLMGKVERYRDRAWQYSKLSDDERDEVKKQTRRHNRENAQTKTTKETEEEEQKKIENQKIEAERDDLLGKVDTQSDIEEEESMSDIEEEAKIARQDEKNTKIARQIERQRKAKIRDPLRHYRFLDQAYIHGMMDGEAVRQKFYTGKPDHVFEIR